MTCQHQPATDDDGSIDLTALAERAASCSGCAQELTWRQSERELFRARQAAPLPGHLWHAIERRVAIHSERRAVRRHKHVQGAALGAFAAAAVVVIWIAWQGDQGGGKQALPSLALDAAPRAGAESPVRSASPPEDAPLGAAELEYQQAIATLEADHARGRRPADRAAPLAAELAGVRQVLSVARAAAPDDPYARRRLLRAYAAYMNKLQTLVLASDVEETP